MNKRTLIAGPLALLVLATLSMQAQTTTLAARSGSKLRLEGTSNIHDWQVESSLIGGSLEVGPNFPLEPGQAATPGKVDAKGEAFVTTRSLKSLEKDGRPYSDKMDDIMYGKLKNPRIVFRVTSLELKEAAKSKDAPYLCEAKGDLVVAEFTNSITMPVNILPLGEKDKKVKISGTTTVKMTAFKIEPPAPAIAMGMIKTGDDVKIIFDWMVAPKAAAAAK